MSQTQNDVHEFPPLNQMQALAIQHSLAIILWKLKRMEKRMTKELDDIKAGVVAVKAAVVDAVAKIKELANKVAAVVDAPADVEAVATDLQSVAAGLEAAINPPAP